MNSCFVGTFEVTSPFGMRTLKGVKEDHKGVDLVGKDDITVYAPCDGTIGSSTRVLVGTTAEWGNYIRLDSADNKYSIFMCHLASRAVAKGQKVKKGDKLGIMGSTGKSTGPHVHFEVRLKGTSTVVNPCDFIGIPNAAGKYKTSEEDETASYVAVLQKAGIVTNPELWKKKASADKDIYWLLKKASAKF